MSRFLSRIWTLAAVVLLAATAACGQAPQVNTSAAASASKTVSVVIPGTDRFSPFALTINQGDTVRWVNNDTDEHVVVTVPDAPETFSLPVQGGGKSATHTFQIPGVYYYYCSIHARYDDKAGQVAALKMASDPTMPMAGVIYVKGT